MTWLKGLLGVWSMVKVHGKIEELILRHFIYKVKNPKEGD
jgi:hypothetical protein